MTSDTAMRVFAMMMMLTLVGSNLAVRRIKLADGLKMGLAWSAIFAIVFVLFTFRGEGRVLWAHVSAELGAHRPLTSGTRLAIPMSDDGHFWVRGEVNGVDVDFLIDSGATTTSLASTVADKSRLALDDMPVSIETANGRVSASTTRIETLRVGNITQENARAVVSPAFGDTNVLGMSFLASLKSWHVDGRTMTLEP